MGSSEPDLRSSPVNSHLSLSRQTLDAGSQTSISGDVSGQWSEGISCPSAVPDAPREDGVEGLEGWWWEWEMG